MGRNSCKWDSISYPTMNGWLMGPPFTSVKQVWLILFQPKTAGLGFFAFGLLIQPITIIILSLRRFWCRSNSTVGHEMQTHPLTESVCLWPERGGDSGDQTRVLTIEYRADKQTKLFTFELMLIRQKLVRNLFVCYFKHQAWTIFRISLYFQIEAWDATRLV